MRNKTVTSPDNAGACPFPSLFTSKLSVESTAVSFFAFLAVKLWSHP
jgi:hypothetical protein